MTAGRKTDLDVLQKWMLAVITHVDGIVSGVDSEAARDQIDLSEQNLDDVILPSRACSSVQRLAVYGNAYYARLVECFQSEFPAFHHALGDEAFTAFVIEYLQHFPPQSYTLSELGKHFPEFLKATRPEQEPGEVLSWPDFLIDLATVERIYNEVFDGPGEEEQTPLLPEELRQVPMTRWDQMSLRTTASLRLVACRFPVHEYISAVRHEETAEVPQPRPSWLAIHRRDYVVRRQPVSELQFCLLQALQSGVPLGAALESALMSCPCDPDDLAAHLQNWFRDWTAARLFTGIRETTIEDDGDVINFR